MSQNPVFLVSSHLHGPVLGPVRLRVRAALAPSGRGTRAPRSPEWVPAPVSRLGRAQVLPLPPLLGQGGAGEPAAPLLPRGSAALHPLPVNLYFTQVRGWGVGGVNDHQ